MDSIFFFVVGMFLMIILNLNWLDDMFYCILSVFLIGNLLKFRFLICVVFFEVGSELIILCELESYIVSLNFLCVRSLYSWFEIFMVSFL